VIPTVSVIIPAHDRRSLIGRAVRSVLAQTFREFEVIVVDDASGDGTPEQVRATFGDQVRLLVQAENRGVSAARNRGISAARGEWLAFLDSDDEWLPEKLERQLDALRASKLRACHTDEIWIRRGVKVNPPARYRKRGGDLFFQALRVCCICPSSLVIRQALCAEVGLFDEHLPVCEDYEFFLRLTAGQPVAYVDEKLVVKYGGHADQLSRAFYAMDRFRVYALDRLLDRRPELGEERREAARSALLEKARIVRAGARKRGNRELMQQMESYLERWE
jgi:glycosyltransferase involved in cell wall biosynthesis